jgi:MFS family permease
VALRTRQGRLSGTFSSLRERNYRLFFSGQVINNIGTWMQRIAQDWLVFTLTGNDPVALGIAAALQFLPTLGLSLWAGVLADRLDKRRLLMALQTGILLCALVLGVLDLTGLVALWQVYVLCFVLGCFTAVETPVRQSFVVEMVGKEHLTNAVALNSTTFNLARVIGPAVAGVMITWIGTGWVFLGNALFTSAVVTGLALMDPARLHRGDAVPRGRGQLREGIRYVRGRKDVLIVLVLVFFVATFGMTFFTSLAIAAANVFHRGADSYGLLSTMMALGTLSGSVLAARRSADSSGATAAGARLRLMLVSAFAFGALEMITGLMPTYLAFGLLLIPVGATLLTFMTTANSTVQLSVDPQMRGRVMGLYMLVFLGGNPIGGPMTGWLAEEFGGRSPFVLGGLVAALSALGCAAFMYRRSRVGRKTDPADPLRST